MLFNNFLTTFLKEEQSSTPNLQIRNERMKLEDIICKMVFVNQKKLFFHIEKLEICMLLSYEVTS